MTELGTIADLEERKTGQGRTYYRIHIGDIWGSYFGGMKGIEEGDEVEYEIEKVDKGGTIYTNFTKISKVDSEEVPKGGMEEKIKEVEEENSGFDLTDRSIMKQTSLKCASEFCSAKVGEKDLHLDSGSVISVAETFYDWLKGDI